MPNEFTEAAIDHSSEDSIQEPNTVFVDEENSEVEEENSSTEEENPVENTTSDENTDKDEDEPSDESENNDDDDDEENSNRRRAYELMQEEYNLLQSENEALRQELAQLKAFKLEIEGQKKDALINKYFMLSDEEKADVIAHKNEYSYEEIESKLAVIYVQKNVDFSMINEENEETEDDPSTTFSLEDTVESVPAIVATLRKIHK